MADDIPLLALLVTSTKDAIFQKMLDVADSLGLNVETWQSGDPTRTTFETLAARLEEREAGVPTMIRGVLLGLSKGAWLTELGKRNYGAPRREATYATCTERLTNGGASVVGAIAVDQLTFYNPTTGATYRNSTGGTLGAGPGATLDVTIVAEVAGSDSSSGVGEITALQTPIAGVTVTNTTAAVGDDDEEDDPYTERIQSKLEALSPGGPRGAYHYAVTTPELQSDELTNITRTLILDDDDEGNAAIFLAGASGAVSAPDVTKAEESIVNWANPFLVNADVFSATNKTLAVTYELWVYDTINLTTAEIEDAVEAALLVAFRQRPIGGDDRAPGVQGKIYQGWIEARILEAVTPHGYRATVTLPAGDTSLVCTYDRDAGTGTAEVAVLGAVTATVHQVER